MVIFYDKTTLEIKSVIHNAMEPELPANMTLEQKREYYNTLNKDFVAVEGDDVMSFMGIEVFNYKPYFDEQGNFVELRPK